MTHDLALEISRLKRENMQLRAKLEAADRLAEAFNHVAACYHMIAEGHPLENFRGCTHPDCEKYKNILENYRDAEVTSE